MKFWLTVLAMWAGMVVALASCQEPSSLTRRAYLDACRVSGYACSEPTPRVHFANIGNNYGMYLCGDFVVLNYNMRPDVDDFHYSILVHEMTHYLQVRQGGNACPFQTKVAQCVLEGEAFEAGYAILRERGEMWHVGFNWRTSYGCGPITASTPSGDKEFRQQQQGQPNGWTDPDQNGGRHNSFRTPEDSRAAT